MVLSGVPVRLAAMFIRQPIIKRLNDFYFDNKSLLGDNTGNQIEVIKRYYQTLLYNSLVALDSNNKNLKLQKTINRRKESGIKDDSLDNFVEDLTNISDLEANMNRTSSKSRKAKLKEKIDQESASIDMTSPEAVIAKGVNDSYESIKKQLKEKGLLKTKC
jgi:hypothetical protein